MPNTPAPGQQIEAPKDDDTPVTVTMVPAVNVATWNVAFVVGNTATPNLTLNSANISTTDPASGVWQFTVSPDTQSLPAGEYQWRFRRVGSGVRRTLATGTLIVTDPP